VGSLIQRLYAFTA